MKTRKRENSHSIHRAIKKLKSNESDEEANQESNSPGFYCTYILNNFEDSSSHPDNYSVKPKNINYQNNDEINKIQNSMKLLQMNLFDREVLDGLKETGALLDCKKYTQNNLTIIEENETMEIVDDKPKYLLCLLTEEDAHEKLISGANSNFYNEIEDL